jgi:HD-GYP domain-containing protein (c-di-GMP phosphodiesterase class II)
MANNGSAPPQFCVAGASALSAPNTAVAKLSDGVLWRLAEQAGWQCRYVNACDSDEMDESVALVELHDAGVDSIRRQFPHALVVSAREDAGADLVLPVVAPEAAMRQLLTHGENHWRRNLKVMSLFREVGARRQRMSQLADIGRSLSTRMNFADLLEAILREARILADCEAGSLYLVDKSDEEHSLVFMLAQNDKVEIPFMQRRLSLTRDSIAGYVALSGEDLDIPDVYHLPADAPYEFNRSFDEQMNYRSRSMLVLPMRDHRDQIVGVLQFINRLEPTSSEPVPFGDEISELLKAVASQAAVSIQKNQLLNDIHRLFESFVQASVKAIEQRDPSTSGHSFRVAETTLALLEDLPKSNFSRFHNLTFSEEHLREVRYAALLHDFGKVGVREDVLLKANKLSDERLEILQYRLELQKERLRRRAVEQELELLHHGPVDIDVARRRVHRQLASELSQLDDFYSLILRANVPNVRDDGDFRHLDDIRDYAFREIDGTLNGLITDLDLMALSVRRGSLTPEERREIQSHVSYTRDFLAVLPWPPELAGVPTIAGAHHEKLDGSGYPLGLAGEQIPLASRVMTVCDIYDALTAMDRPYKRSMSLEVALSILDDEARQGLLDVDIVQVFKDSRVYQRSGGSLSHQVV